MSKINDLRIHAAQNKPDVIALNEIKPKNGAVPEPRSFNIPGYTPYTNNLEDPDVRGVCVYVRNCFKSNHVNIPDHNFKDVATVAINTQNSCLMIQCIYRSGTVKKAQELDDELHKLLRKSSTIQGFNQKITVGDFNLNKVNWTPEPIVPDNIPANSPENKFVDLLHDIHVTQHVCKETRYREGHTPTIDDLILSTNETDISNLTYDPGMGKSDHITLNCDIQLRNYINILSQPKIILKYDRADYDKIRQEMNIDWKDKFDGKSGQACIDIFEDIYNTAVKKHVPSIKVNAEYEKPKWMSRSTWSRVRKKHSKWIKYLITRQPSDYKEYTKVRNEVTHANMKERRNYEKSISRDVRKNPKGVRNYMKSTNRVKATIPNLVRKDGSTATTDKEIAEALSDQYSSVFTEEDLENIPEMPPKPLITNPLSKFQFLENKVKKALQSLDKTKSPGLDQVHPQVLKETASIVASPITHIFEKCQEEGIFPSQWLKASITPIFKKGNRSDPGNYRPVSLTCVLCKTMERLMVEQMLQHAIENYLLTSHQHGFTPCRSVTTNLLEVLNKWTESLMHEIPVDILYLDYCKAFDTVPHSRLLNQISTFGIQGEALQLIKAFLSNRQQKVVANGCSSEWKPVKSGVPQGSVLGPVLFSWFVNDIPALLDNSVTMYADDTKLHAALTQPDTPQRLQQDLQKLEEWAKNMQMKFHPAKCKVMHLGNNNPDYPYTMTKEDGTIHTLEEAIIEKDLGVHVNYSLTFTYHCKQKIAAATKTTNYIKHTFQYMDKEIFLLLYKSLVRPLLEFASTVWNPAQKFNSNAIEKVQRRATRMVPELKGLRYKERLQELGLETLAYRRKRADLLEAFRIINRDHSIDINCSCTLCPDKAMFNPAPSASSTTRGNSKKMYVHAATGKRKNFFATRVTPAWNSLSDATVNSRTIDEFKRNLKSDIGHTAFDYEW